MSSDGEDNLQFHHHQQQQQQRPAAGGTPGSAFGSAPGQADGGADVGGADSGSDSSDEDIGKEFAQAAELHRSSSAGALTGASPAANHNPPACSSLHRPVTVQQSRW